MEPVINHKVVRFIATVMGMTCEVVATLEDSANLETGDAISVTSIDSILCREDNQLILTKSLSTKEFYNLVLSARSLKTL